MQQRIDFFRLLPADPSRPATLTHKRMAGIYGFFLICLALLSCLDLWQQYILQKQTNIINGERTVAQQRLATLMAEYPNLDTAQAMAALQTAQQKQSALATAMAVGANLSDILKGFSTAVVPGVWLTEVHFTRNDNHIDVDGRATDPIAVRQFMAALARQPVFTGVAFQLTLLDQAPTTGLNKTRDAFFAFHIRTKVLVT